MIALLIGVFVGISAGFLMIDNADFIVVNVLAGIVGSILGLATYFIFLGGILGDSFFSGRATICSALGALIVVLLFDGLHKLMSARTRTTR